MSKTVKSLKSVLLLTDISLRGKPHIKTNKQTKTSISLYTLKVILKNTNPKVT